MRNASPSGCCVLFIDNPPDGFPNNNTALQSVKQHNVFAQLSLIKKTNSNNRKTGIHTSKDRLSAGSKGNFFVVSNNGLRAPADRERSESRSSGMWDKWGTVCVSQTGGVVEQCGGCSSWTHLQVPVAINTDH